jgi:hypothetical protein
VDGRDCCAFIDRVLHALEQTASARVVTITLQVFAGERCFHDPSRKSKQRQTFLARTRNAQRSWDEQAILCNPAHRHSLAPLCIEKERQRRDHKRVVYVSLLFPNLVHVRTLALLKSPMLFLIPVEVALFVSSSDPSKILIKYPPISISLSLERSKKKTPYRSADS